MSHTKRETTEVRVRRRGFFTTHHRFSTGDRTLGELTLPAFAQSNVFRAEDGRDLAMRLPRWLSTEHEMFEGGRVRGRAGRSGLFQFHLEVEYEGQAYTMEPAGALSEKWRLMDAQDLILLSIEPQGCLSGEVRLYPQPGVHRDLVVFAYYLVHMRREETAAACAAIG